jgi:hypothetical protein
MVIVGYSNGSVLMFNRSGDVVRISLSHMFYSHPVLSAFQASLCFSRTFAHLRHRQVAEARGHTGSILSMTIARDVDALVTSSADHTLRVWSLDTGSELCGYQMFAGASLFDAVRGVMVVGGHDGRVLALRFVPSLSGRLAAAVLRREEGHAAGVTALAYDGAADTLLSGDIGGKVRVWRGFTAAPLAAPLPARPLDDAAVAQLLTALERDPPGASLSGALLHRY